MLTTVFNDNVFDCLHPTITNDITILFVFCLGYRLQGNPNIICLIDGKWTHIMFTCEKLNCPNPPNLLNGFQEANDYSFESIVNYDCNAGVLTFTIWH